MLDDVGRNAGLGQQSTCVLTSALRKVEVGNMALLNEGWQS